MSYYRELKPATSRVSINLTVFELSVLSSLKPQLHPRLLLPRIHFHNHLEKEGLPLKELGLNITITTEKMDASLTKSNIYHAQWMRQNYCHTLLVLRKQTSELESQVLHCTPKQGSRQQVNALCSAVQHGQMQIFSSKKCSPNTFFRNDGKRCHQ